MTVRTVKFGNPETAANVFGSFDSNLKILQREYGVSIASRDGEIKISGDKAESCARVMEALGKLAAGGESVDEQKVRYFMAAEEQDENLADDAEVLLDGEVVVPGRFFADMVKMLTTAFDNGITHFDLANNYGPEAGSAESNLHGVHATGSHCLGSGDGIFYLVQNDNGDDDGVCESFHYSHDYLAS